MKIVMPGGNGHVGLLVRACLAPKGWEVVTLSRSPRSGEVPWDGETLGPWACEFEDADVVLNLAGRSVNCRYNAKNLKEMRDSRVRSTRAVGQTIAGCRNPPRLWLQSSSATIYGHRLDAPNDEATGIIAANEPPKWMASVDLVKAWEAEQRNADTPKSRKVALRTSLVMSVERGGVFEVMSTLARRGLMGTAGDGRQYVSWIHGRDFVRTVEFLIAHEEIDGAVNVCSPNPLPNAEFNRILRQATGAKLGLPAPAWALEIGAFLMGTETELIMKSRRVVPGRLLEAGFVFDYPSWREAATDLVKRMASGQPVC